MIIYYPWISLNTSIMKIVVFIRLHRMHEMLTIVTDVRGVCQSVCQFVLRLKSAAARTVYAARRVCAGSFGAAFGFWLYFLLVCSCSSQLVLCRLVFCHPAYSLHFPGFDGFVLLLSWHVVAPPLGSIHNKHWALGRIEHNVHNVAYCERLSRSVVCQSVCLSFCCSGQK